MARIVGRKINISKNVNITETVVRETIKEINIKPEYRSIAAVISLFNDSNELISEESYGIEGDNYDILMSADEIFDEGKVEGCFRETDLWRVIDKITIQN